MTILSGHDFAPLVRTFLHVSMLSQPDSSFRDTGISNSHQERCMGRSSYVRVRLAANFFLTMVGTNGAWEWRIFDVGGCRTTVGQLPGVPPIFISFSGMHGFLSSRTPTVGDPYIVRLGESHFFVIVIVFLCPVSCFDERLEEDSNVNRLEDSINLWRSICSSKLLSKTQLILFMNK